MYLFHVCILVHLVKQVTSDKVIQVYEDGSLCHICHLVLLHGRFLRYRGLDCGLPELTVASDKQKWSSGYKMLKAIWILRWTC